jgi:MFS family permease
MTPRAIAALGITQCINWGVLYYAFAVLVVPLQRELGVRTWVVTGAFSLALLVSAAIAPAVGRSADRGHGASVMQWGAIAATVLLIGWSLLSGTVALYVVWGGLGLCMAATLYEPAFVIVARAVDDPSKRLRALAGVTVFGGAASTVFLPLTSFLVEAIGWRSSVLVLAALLVLSAITTRIFVSGHMEGAGPAQSPSPPIAAGEYTGGDSGRFPFVATSFAVTSAAGAGFAANLVPALGAHGAPPATAAMLGALMGVMQIPGRALVLTGTLAGSPARLLGISLFLQALGLLGVAAGPSLPMVAAGVMTFALGAGLTTIVRPYLVQSLFAGAVGHFNGRIARYQQLARAAAPLAIAWLGGIAGYSAVFAGIAGAFALLAVASSFVIGKRAAPRELPSFRELTRHPSAMRCGETPRRIDQQETKSSGET